MVAIDENEINGRFAAGDKLMASVSAGHAEPADPAVTHFRHFLQCNPPLRAKAQPSDRIRINADQHTVGRHCTPEAGTRDTMPGADFNQTFAAGRKSSQTVSFFVAGLRLGPSPAAHPEHE